MVPPVTPLSLWTSLVNLASQANGYFLGSLNFTCCFSTSFLIIFDTLESEKRGFTLLWLDPGCCLCQGDGLWEPGCRPLSPGRERTQLPVWGMMGNCKLLKAMEEHRPLPVFVSKRMAHQDISANLLRKAIKTSASSPWHPQIYLNFLENTFFLVHILLLLALLPVVNKIYYLLAIFFTMLINKTIIVQGSYIFIT